METSTDMDRSDLFGAGPVPEHSALAGFLRDRVYRDALGLSGPGLRFVLEPLGDGAVVHCAELGTGRPILLKVYGLKWIDGRRWDRAALRARLVRREFENLRRARDLGLDRPPHRVVRPLAVSENLGCTLAEEYVPGPDLLHHIENAACRSRHEDLDAQLTLTAGFLAGLHGASPLVRPVDGHEAVAYLEKVVGQLAESGVLGAEEAGRLLRTGRAWAASGRLSRCDAGLVHGDATPTQFLFPTSGELVAVDFERLQYGDPAADIGRLAGELKHLFRMHTGDAWASEPHIRHFYAAYLDAAPTTPAPAALLDRARFHMACSELRIARNSWVDMDNRRYLVQEAAACMAL